MYLLQELMKVTNSRQTEAVKRLEWIHSLMQPAPGFSGAQVFRFLGNASDYMILLRWESQGAWEAFRATPEGANYPKNRPEGLYEPIPTEYNWDLVIDSQGSPGGDYVTRSLYAVESSRADEFITNRQRHDALALKVAG